MRLLFAFIDCPSGQVASLLAARLGGAMPAGGLAVESVFPAEHGARAILSPFGPVHLEPSAPKLRQLAEARGYDAAIVIDAPAYLDALAEEPKQIPVIAELRAP